MSKGLRVDYVVLVLIVTLAGSMLNVTRTVDANDQSVDQYMDLLGNYGACGLACNDGCCDQTCKYHRGATAFGLCVDLGRRRQEMWGSEKEAKEIVYVALSEDAIENSSILNWAVEKSGGKGVCSIHVRQPATQNLDIDEEVDSFTKQAREDTFGEYPRHGAIQKLYLEADSVEKGVIQLMEQHEIRKLVMGSAAKKSYFGRTELRSKKAIYIRDNAPPFCQIWFICNNVLIYTRKAITPPESSRVRDAAAPPETDEGTASSTSSDLFPGRNSTESTDSTGEFSRGCLSPSSSTFMDSTINDQLYDQFVQAMTEAENSRQEAFEETKRLRKVEKQAFHNAIDLHKAIQVEAEKAKRLYYEESRLRKAAEEELTAGKEELAKAKEELAKAKEELAKAKEELAKVKEQLVELDMVKEERDFNSKLWSEAASELRETLLQKCALESHFQKSNHSLRESEQNLISALQSLHKYKDELKETQMERDNALKEAEELRKQLDQGPSSSRVPVCISEFSYSDLEKATNDFDPNLKIGEGGYGSIYKGFLHQTDVAIKILNPDSAQGPREFDQEVDVLSKLRHPNLVSLVGACHDSYALVYEYLPGGSLEDRLVCKNNALPLPWQTRIRIATELCSALIFLHSSQPDCIIHSDLKPANVLLDDNCVCKLGDFGICRVLPNGKTSVVEQSTLIINTQPKGTLPYMDPEFLFTGELTPKSDVYSFGIILLRLLTGKSPVGIAKEVRYALDKGTLDMILDRSAGDWPFVLAEQLARIALMCCNKKRKNRPDLESRVWRVLEPMKVSYQNPSMNRLASDNQAPNHFLCPIVLEIMKDPHVAPDGFTYEAAAIRSWLDSGYNSSPMTNIPLENHNLIPNHALRSAIQEWLQHNQIG